MYSNKKNVNILTSLLVEHGVRHVVVCPGSRNAPLVHNFSQCEAIVCHQATDERSAGFIALGLRQQCQSPVAVCVTSGSALLNVLPAAAEASYQHQGIIVISADRPAAWVDQLDGQTLPQPQALGCFASVSVSLPEVTEDDTQAWYCNRLVNEAILANKAPGHPSVHINVPITEPLFEFDVETLPKERCVRSGSWNEPGVRSTVLDSYTAAKRPMIILGQLPAENALGADTIASLLKRAVILSEPISMEGLPASYTDQMLSVLDESQDEYRPDWVLYAGGHTVSKRLRRFMRSLGQETMQILVSEDGRLRDVSQHTEWMLASDASEVLESLAGQAADQSKQSFIERWERLRSTVSERQAGFTPSYSQMMAVSMFERMARKEDASVYYANSMSVRLAALFSEGYCYCNRGLNGIEGSLSVAAGASLADSDKRVYCVIGDLSFFYDQNALWQQLGGNLRILLLNNGQGGIFKVLEGLEKSPVRDTLISGGHDASAKGICLQYKLDYRSADDESGLREGLEWLVDGTSSTPMLLEVCTCAEDDAEEFKRLYAQLRQL